MKNDKDKKVLVIILAILVCCFLCITIASLVVNLFPVKQYLTGIDDAINEPLKDKPYDSVEPTTKPDDNGFACEQSPDGASVSQEEAVELVRTRPEVQEYISSLSAKGAQGLVEYDHDECNTYSIHVYEIKDDHTATFNWYDVDMYTGEVTTMFDF